MLDKTYQYSNTEIQQAQKTLSELHYSPEKTDGIMGPHTVNAIIAFQKQNTLHIEILYTLKYSTH